MMAGQIPPPGQLILSKFSLDGPWGLRRLKAIMSTTYRRNYTQYQRLTKTGNLLSLGKNYQAKKQIFIPFCLKNGRHYPSSSQIVAFFGMSFSRGGFQA